MKITTNVMKKIDPNIIENAMTYSAYRRFIDEKFAHDLTTGTDHSPSMLNYTKLNLSRMNRLDKRGKLTPETMEILDKINRPMIWLVITEGWCGDAAQIVPILHKMSEQQTHIQLRFILRDEHPAIIDAFLTNGSRSIPKVLIINPMTFEVMRTWGPRPVEMQTMVMEIKEKKLLTSDPEEKQLLADQSAKKLHLWYAKDKTKTTQQEFLSVVELLI